MMKSDYIAVKGKVLNVLPNTFFNVKLENDSIIRCTISGKMRLNHIKVIEDDNVLVELSVYDLTNGRIVRRF